MDFFQHQHAARKNTRLMIVLYLIAVAGVVLAVDLLLAGIYVTAADMRFRPGTGISAMLLAVPGRVYAWGALGTVAVIFTASLVQILKLAQGGSAVADMVGARAVRPDTQDPLERRLLNVIEEMAIAAGVRVPRAYVMDGESGINAFAAGYDVGNAIIAVTRGTLETLNRDELQGVVGHEFSHILNGDMWLNIKMIGVLSGIVFIGGVGGFLMRSVRAGRGSKGAGGLFAIGLALFVIGYMGMFCARIIKAAVSRQREYLADASSVQFTRNPDGIAGALDQIRSSGRGALLASRYAEDMSHMFFGQGISFWMTGLFATHPPIEERIARVRPGFPATRYRLNRAPPAAPDEEGAGAGQALASAAGFAASAAAWRTPDGQRVGDSGNAWGRSAGESVGLVGTLDAAGVDYAARLIGRLPAELHAAIHESADACAVVVAMLLASKRDVLETQLEAVRALGQAAFAGRVQALLPSLQGLGRGSVLMVIDLALPAIKQAGAEQRQQLLVALVAVIHADRRVSLHEFVVLTLVRTQLVPRAKPGAGKSRPLSAVRDEVVLLLSLVAHAGRRSGLAADQAVEDAFAAGVRVVGMGDARLLPRDGFSLESAGSALEALISVAPLAKAVLVKSLFATVASDGTIRLIEAELMRLIGAVLDCPLPPHFEQIDPDTLAG